MAAIGGPQGELDKTYDAAGNLLKVVAQPTISTVNYTYDALNRLGYTYDFENHVIQAGAGITLVYDAMP